MKARIIHGRSGIITIQGAVGQILEGNSLGATLGNTPMQFGHNTNVKVGDAVYHVQTEDHGAAQALIETTVYQEGRLVHKRRLNYKDLLPLNGAKEATLKQRLDKQHHVVMEEIRSGKLKLTIPAAKPAADSPVTVAAFESGPKLTLRIQNPRDWLKGGHASLKVRVTDEMSNPIAKARVVARMEGAAEPVEIGGLTDADGSTSLEFDVPKFEVAEPFLLVDANWGSVAGHLRLQFKTKPPKVPAA